MAHSQESTPSGNPEDLAAEVRNLLAGDVGAKDRLVAALEPALLRTAAGMLGRDDAEAQDIVQDSMVAILNYLLGKGGFEGDLVRFGITVVRNRCRNLILARRRRPQVPLEPLGEWLANPDRSPLDLLLEKERLALLQATLDALDPGCRDLLRALYLEGRTVKEILRRSDVGTVQAIYYRRATCLDRAFEILNERLAGCSPEQERAGDRDRDANEGRAGREEPEP